MIEDKNVKGHSQPSRQTYANKHKKKNMRKHGLPVELQNSRNWKLYNMGGVIWVKCIVLGRACSGSLNTEKGSLYLLFNLIVLSDIY